MGADSGTSAGRDPGREPAPARWEFRAAAVGRSRLDEPVLVARGVETIPVREAVVVRLVGRFNPGGVGWFDSFLPTLRVGDAVSTRMTSDDDGVRFTFYPDVDGEPTGGAVEFRARLDEDFEPTGLEI
jgi:hypothetical protein